jgi:hypothetical protein
LKQRTCSLDWAVPFFQQNAVCSREMGIAGHMAARGWQVILNSGNEASDRGSITHLSRLPELAISISQFDLRQEIRLLRKEESWRRGIGRSSRTLVKQQDFSHRFSSYEAKNHSDRASDECKNLDPDDLGTHPGTGPKREHDRTAGFGLTRAGFVHPI